MLLIISLIAIEGAIGAVVSGKLYDGHFNQLNNVLVEITTFPTQSFVSKDGAYSFTLTDGRYTLIAYFRQQNGTTIFTSKEVLVSGGGSYTVDLILDQPFTGVPPVITLPLSTRIFNALKKNYPFILFGVFLAAVFVSVLVILWRKLRRAKPPQPSKPELPIELSQLLALVAKGGGRVTQRELRKKLPDISEAKISLMISELEASGHLTKIKKGRGNIIVLKRGK